MDVKYGDSMEQELGVDPGYEAQATCPEALERD